MLMITLYAEQKKRHRFIGLHSLMNTFFMVTLLFFLSSFKIRRDLETSKDSVKKPNERV